MNQIEKTYIFNIIDPISEGQRIDFFLSHKLKDLSRSRVVELIKNKYIKVNSKIVDKSYKIKINDEIKIDIPKIKYCDIKPEDITLDIIYEDNDLLIVNKPKNMIVHPANGVYSGTLVNALLFHCKDSLSGINGIARPGIVHRIDKNTSGLLIVAKNDIAHINLAQQIKEHSFKRVYHAIVYGNLKNKNGIIEEPIGRSQYDRKKMCVTYKNSKSATTIYEILKDFKNFSYLRLFLKTGRTHQIRVHMSYIGHPIAGDEVYGPKKCIKSLNGQCLHAKIIGFIHPTTGKYLEFDSSLPDYFKHFLFDCENKLQLKNIN